MRCRKFSAQIHISFQFRLWLRHSTRCIKTTIQKIYYVQHPILASILGLYRVLQTYFYCLIFTVWSWNSEAMKSLARLSETSWCSCFSCSIVEWFKMLRRSKRRNISGSSTEEVSPVKDIKLKPDSQQSQDVYVDATIQSCVIVVSLLRSWYL